jgi:L-alanine-DL-glutamate epimerase-like enolase superfamily enzyme
MAIHDLAKKETPHGTVTVVWRGRQDQTHVSYQEEAEHAVKLKKAGYRGIKFRAWRTKPMDHVDEAGVVRDAVEPDFAIMFDRTADWAGWVWDLETAVKVCRSMEKHDVLWIE